MLAGRYRLGPILGRGGVAEVYAGDDLRLDRPVAVKLLRPELAVDPTVRSRFEAEARTAARLSHPNVVAIYDTGEDGRRAFIVMERLPGLTLGDELVDGPMSEQRCRQVALQVLAALEAAHGAGIVHRDIKPANVLTCSDGRVKVADFGIATLGDAASSLTTTGLLVGTPAYLAPERLDGYAATPVTDLYSVGALLYQCLTGRKPLEAETTFELLAAIRERKPPPLSDIRPALDPALVSAVEKAMEKDPARRFGSAAEMAAALRAAPVPDTTVRLEPTRVLAEGMGAPGRADAAIGVAAPGAAAATSVVAPVAGPPPVAGPSVPSDTGTRRHVGPGPTLGPRRLRPARVGWWAMAPVVLVLLVVVAVIASQHHGRAGGTPATTSSLSPAGGSGSAPLPSPLSRALSNLSQAVSP